MAESNKTTDIKGKDATSESAAGTAPVGSRGPWTPAEEEAISLLMELMPMLAEAHVAAKRSWCRKRGESERNVKETEKG